MALEEPRSPTPTSAAAGEPPPALKPPVDPSTLAHRQLREGPFWQQDPGLRRGRRGEFLDHKWQAKNSITNSAKLLAAIQELVSEEFIEDVERGFRGAPMWVRVSPYLLSLIDWADPYDDPLRRQFIPVASRLLPDHPKLDARLAARAGRRAGAGAHAPLPRQGAVPAARHVPGLLPLLHAQLRGRRRHRRGREGSAQGQRGALAARVRRTSRSRPELEDIVISGGDAYQLRAEQITQIGDALLAMPNMRRMRFATKGPAVMPMKILTDDEWLDALTARRRAGRKLHKEVVLHTHFNHPNEITAITKARDGRLFERGIIVRNQSVLQRGVNDTVATMQLLVKRLGHVNVHPYYVYVHDLVKGVEDLRTTLSDRRSTSRSTCAARPPASTRRRSSSTRRAAAASATRTRTSTTIARPASRCSRRRRSPGRSSSTSIRSTSCRRRDRRAGPIRAAPGDDRRGARGGARGVSLSADGAGKR